MLPLWEDAYGSVVAPVNIECLGTPTRMASRWRQAGSSLFPVLYAIENDPALRRLPTVGQHR